MKNTPSARNGGEENAVSATIPRRIQNALWIVWRRNAALSHRWAERPSAVASRWTEVPAITVRRSAGTAGR